MTCVLLVGSAKCTRRGVSRWLRAAHGGSDAACGEGQVTAASRPGSRPGPPGRQGRHAGRVTGSKALGTLRGNGGKERAFGGASRCALGTREAACPRVGRHRAQGSPPPSSSDALLQARRKRPPGVTRDLRLHVEACAPSLRGGAALVQGGPGIRARRPPPGSLTPGSQSSAVPWELADPEEAEDQPHGAAFSSSDELRPPR